ncbi:MAG: hypothetical protein PF692_14165 [Kiritimatiellae bacterium]|jgi:hypothetical protein|nr:hypothetical protein [Kiritimatiellia bacterium]
MRMRSYDKPQVKKIELATEEVLNSGCVSGQCEIDGLFRAGGS